MVQSGAPLNLSNISRTNTYIGPAIQLRKKGVVIAFGSMYGNTRAIAQQLAKQLSKRGVTDIRIYDVSKTNASYIISDAWKYTNLVTIAPTYNLNLYLTMENFIHELKALNFQNHKVSIIGNHSWASAAMKTMVSHFENDFKDIEIVSEPLDIKSSLKEEDLPLIEKNGRRYQSVH